MIILSDKYRFRRTINLMALLALFSSYHYFAQQPTQDADEAIKQSAIRQMQEGRYGEAIDLLNKYVTSNPRKPDGYNYRGLCYENRGQFQNAVLDFRRAIALDPGFNEASVNLARTQEVWYAQLRKKITGHEREIAIDPNVPYNYLEIGKCYRWMEEWIKAEEWYDQYLARDENASPDEIIRYTEILAKNNHIKKGEIILKKWLEKYPEDWRLWSRYGYFTMWLGNYRNAENAFRTALGFKPYFKEAEDGLDQATKKAYVTQQDPRSFEKEFPIDRYYRILKSSPNDLDTRFALIDELIKAERIEEAYQQLMSLSVEKSDDPRFQDRWDYVNNFREEVYKQRIDDFEARFEANPKDKNTAARLAEYYSYLEEYDRAQEVLEKYFKEVPDEPDELLKFQYAKIAAWSRDFETAIELTDQLLKVSPDNLDYQLFRAQLSIWNDREIELIGPYLENVLASRPNNLEALVAMGSYMLMEQKFDSAQEYANKAAAIDPLDNDVITLQTNIDFQKLRAEEEARYAILEEGRRHVLDGDCPAALPFYERYLSESDPNDIILKEYADVLFCAKRYNDALGIYDEVLREGYFYEAALQRSKLLYSMGDSLGAIEGFKDLNKRNPGDYETYLYLGDSYAKAGYNDSAIAVYDSLLTWESLDSSQTAMVEQRMDWIPPSGLMGIIRTFPASAGIAPSATFYTDNTTFRYSKMGARADLGITNLISLGVSYYRTSTSANRYSLDSAKVHAVDSVTNVKNTFSRQFTSFKGHLFLRFSENFRMEFASGTVTASSNYRKIETEVAATYEMKDTLLLSANYQSSDAAIILYSPYLIDYNVKGERYFSTLYRFQGKYNHKKKYIFGATYQYITNSDGNMGNDFIIRIGQYFDKDLTAGYEYYYSNFRYVNVPYYYSPSDFEAHSVWGELIIEKSKNIDVSIGGKVGYIPSSQFLQLEGHVDAFYRFVSNFQIRGNFSMGSTSRDNSSYRFFSGSLSAYWSF